MTALRQRMLEDLQIRHYSKTTIRLYLHAVSVFSQHFGKPPDQLDAEHVRRYQLFLVQEKKVSLSTFIQVVSALRFFYTHTLHQKIPIERIPLPPVAGGATRARTPAQFPRFWALAPVTNGGPQRSLRGAR